MNAITWTMPWKMRRVMRRLGPAGFLGIALSTAALVTLLAGVIPLRDEIENLRTELAMRPPKPATAVPVLPPDQLLAKELAAFQAKFPTVDELSDELDTLFILARDKGLETNKGEYALVEKMGGLYAASKSRCRSRGLIRRSMASFWTYLRDCPRRRSPILR
ncbi:MAG: hypothetical protein ABI167_02730 [Nitrosospira sp.]